MHGSCTCCDSHAEAVRLMMTSPRIGCGGTAALVAKPGESGANNTRAAPRTNRAEFMSGIRVRSSPKCFRSWCLDLRLQLPTLAIITMDVLGCLGGVLGEHLRTVPFQFLAGAHRHAAEQHDLRQISCDIEVGVSRRAALARGNPFLVLAFIRPAFEQIPRQ